ncbi:MAG: hypothetical protein V4773_02140 [Verrucomicrobiota bacterium]
MTELRPGWRLGRVLWAVLALLLLLHLAVRIIPPLREMVQPGGEIVLPDNDSWFHYREALYTNAHFPAIQRVEDTSRYPEVERIEASGLWDVTLAGLARIVALGEASPRAVAWVCLLLPPLLGAVVFLLLARVAAVDGPPALGVWLVAWGVLAPGATLTRTGLGFCDHHVAEMVLSLVCLLAVLHALRRVAHEPPRAWWRLAWLEVAPLVVFVFTWVGAPIYVLLTALVFGVAVLARVIEGLPAAPVARAGARLLAAFVVLAGLASLVWPDLVMRRDIFKVALGGAGIAAVALPALVWCLEPAARRFGAVRAVLGWAALVAALAAIAYVVSPTLRAYSGFLLGRKSPLVQENAPVTLLFYFKVTGIPGVIAIATIAIGIVTDAWRRLTWLVTVAWSFSLLMLWYRTWDYDYLAGLHALVLAGCAIAAIGTLREKQGKPALCRPALAGITAGVAVLAVGYGIGGSPYIPASIYRDRLMVAHPGWRQAMAWLRAQPAPPAPDLTQKLPRGRSGVLSEWGTGNLVNTLGGWPAVSARYMDAEAIEPLMRETEAAVRSAPLRGSTVAEAVRYVVFDAALLGRYFDGTLRSSGRDPKDFETKEAIAGAGGRIKVFTTLGPKYRALFAHQLAVDGGPGLQHFRLMYESPQETFLRQRIGAKTSLTETWSDFVETPEQRVQTAAACAAGFWQEPEGQAFAGHILPSVRIYEQVPGAQVIGRATPGRRVTFTLPLRAHATGRRFVYEQTVVADGAGLFRLIVPYATEPVPGSDVKPDGPADLAHAATHRPIAISEAAVQAGETIDTGDWMIPR